MKEARKEEGRMVGGGKEEWEGGREEGKKKDNRDTVTDTD